MPTMYIRHWDTIMNRPDLASWMLCPIFLATSSLVGVPPPQRVYKFLKGGSLYLLSPHHTPFALNGRFRDLQVDTISSVTFIDQSLNQLNTAVTQSLCAFNPWNGAGRPRGTQPKAIKSIPLPPDQAKTWARSIGGASAE